MNRIVDSYLVREVTRTCVGVTLVLLLVLIGNQFARVLGRAASERLPQDAVMELIGLKTLEYLTVLVPLAFFFSVMLALGRLHRDSEISALAACGIGPGRLFRALLGLAGIVALIMTWLAFDVGPRVTHASFVLKEEARRELAATLLAPGRFRTSPDGSLVFHARDEADDGRLEGVFIQRRNSDEVEVAVARYGLQREVGDTGDYEIVLYDGYRYDGVPGTVDFRIVEFAEHGVPIPLPDISSPPGEREIVPTSDLFGSDDPLDIAELQWRISIPIMVMVFAMLAVPLSSSRPREGRYARLALGLLAYLIYTNLLGAVRVLLENGKIPAMVGLWWVHGVMIAAAVLATLWQAGGRMRWYSRRRTAPA